jgi:hypothetical protein
VHVLAAAALLFSCDFADGLPHGASVSFWGSDSTVASQTSWSSGSGVLSIFHDNSTLYRSQVFQDGLRHGASAEYRRDATLRYTEQFFQAAQHLALMSSPRTNRAHCNRRA